VVKVGGFVEMILVVGDVSGVEESTGVGGVGREECGELSGGGFPVRFCDGGFRVGELRGDLLGLRGVGLGLLLGGG
jgi:hypothetical protein